MKSTNYHFRGDAATVKRVKEEYEYIGRYVELIDANHLVVLALPPKKESKKPKHGQRSKRTTGQDRKEA